ncbi:MAG: toprim domain-containing protein [Actinomycetota bacterium]|nr:toprim domain-containing protein [Actinomycetota bacterium]
MSQQAVPPILAVAARYTALRRAGEGLYVGACPYPDHREPEAVFRVDAKSGVCLCAGTRLADGSPRGGCGRGGSAVSLIRDVEDVSRAEAEAMLDELLGGDGPKGRARARRACAWAARYARRWLVDGDAPDVRQARNYLDHRGLSADVLDAYGVGYVPRQGVAQAARKRGAEYGDLIRGGVLSGKGKEMFAGRIVFPLRDPLSRVVGFGGRVLPGSKARAKYINSSGSEMFDKGSFLYGLDLALPYIRRERRAVVVEGYTDVLALHQAGIKNVVAALGTALTEHHVRALSPHADEVVLVFDPDAAGVAAAMKAAELRGSGPALSAVVLDEDPADYADNRGAEAVRAALSEAAPVPVAIARARGGGGASGTRVGEAWRGLEAFSGEHLGAER